MQVDDNIVYSINVFADGPGGANGCGASGRNITFAVNGQSTLPRVEWNNDQVWNVSLGSAAITNLAAVNSSPTALGQATIFTATAIGNDINYTWGFGDGTATSSRANVIHTYGAIGVYTALVTATNSASSITATTWVTIVDAPISDLVARNSSPTVIGNATTFTATAGGGSNVVYQWRFGDGTATATGANPSHTYPAVGVYTALVTATNSASSISATTVVVITATQPIADAGPDQAVKSQAIVTLDGSASFDPNDFQPLTFGWTQSGGQPVVLSSDTITQPTFTAPAVTTSVQLTFTLVVTNVYGLVSVSDTVIIDVQPYTCLLPLVRK